MPEPVGFEEIHPLLLEASRKAFTEIQRQHTDERFYGFGLFHEPLWLDIYSVANAEEALIREAQEYQLDKYNLGYAQKSIEQLAQELRWSTGDWAYLEWENPHFESVNAWLREKDIHGLCMAVDDTEFDVIQGKMIAICQDVLRLLDVESVFGTGAVREQVVINILMGDQDPSWYEYAKRLNPPAVYERWVAEVDLPARPNPLL